MSATADFIPKVHPLTRNVEPEDPLEFMAQSAPGDPDVMLDCVIQEFAWIGCDAEEMFGMFQNPGYPVLNQLLDLFGAAEVRRRLNALVGSGGIFRVRETIDEAAQTDEPELIQLTIRNV